MAPNLKAEHGKMDKLLASSFFFILLCLSLVGKPANTCWCSIWYVFFPSAKWEFHWVVRRQQLIVTIIRNDCFPRSFPILEHCRHVSVSDSPPWSERFRPSFPSDILPLVGWSAWSIPTRSTTFLPCPHYDEAEESKSNLDLRLKT